MKKNKFWKKYLVCALFTSLLFASCDSINDNISSDTNTEISSVVNAQDASMAVVFNQSISANDLDNITIAFPDSVDTTNLDLTKSLSYDEKTVVLEFNEIYTSSGEVIEITVTFNGQSTTVSYTTAVSDDSDNSGDSSSSSSYLIISEYIEGSSNNKAIELYNTSSGAINLSDYTVKLFNGGNSSAGNTEALSGTLEAGEVHVIVNSGASFAADDYVDIDSTVTYFNGDDAVALYKSDELVDIVGTIGSSESFAQDKTLIRNTNIATGSTTYDSSQWTEQSKDYFKSLGTHYGITNSYYGTISDSLTGDNLKSALNDIIDGHTEFPYTSDSTDTWDALKITDQDPDNSDNVILLYTGRSADKDDQDTGTGGDLWNREHVWAKSHGDFGTSMGAGTDLHHLRAADSSVNSARGNKEFDEGGTAHSEATECYTDSDSWEPRDEVKGDIARMLFYMAVRYEGENGEVDLQMSEDINDANASPTHGKLSTLLKWNEEDPVSETEIRRNHIIFHDYQGNRNPFIDHPEYADLIWE